VKKGKQNGGGFTIKKRVSLGNGGGFTIKKRVSLGYNNNREQDLDVVCNKRVNSSHLAL
jgi:hypothetical protein